MHVRNVGQGQPEGASEGAPRRSTQAERRARTRSALLESAARGLSRYGYRNLVLEQVAKEAGYTRGALYHLFKDKQELTLAVSDWVLDTWRQEVGAQIAKEPDPVAALLTLARAHTAFCRRDIARVAMALRLEFAGQDHPIGREVEQAYEVLLARCEGLIEAGRREGSIPDGPPVRAVALAFVGTVEGASIALAGHVPEDGALVASAAAGTLGLDPGTTYPSPSKEAQP
ncbi:TetR/AcrR family transcriptional regulator [Streptomyces spinoverrucosus]|uniref:TetR/AcrR family transcriptional regulator n=1 Tax=Streptomyces spinoverrucosus TaxID=284043 RepID=UPI0018C40351|nr:TetR/AcrR family transcriptional regulator [Streptomyces spinoverrucosus]MBG0857764.1 TetR/AcrR family transcriptional regulator [Streptomyces spinoverrucosus]